jgi:hypothetical protein
MTGYKYRIFHDLQKSGWEVFETKDKNLEWWGDEQWVIKSVREHWGLEIYITF